MKKEFIIARIKDASGDNYDIYEHTIIGLYDNIDYIYESFDRWLLENDAINKKNHIFYLEVLDIDLNEYASLSSRGKDVWRRIK